MSCPMSLICTMKMLQLDDGRSNARYNGSVNVQTFRGSSRLTSMCDQAMVEREADQWSSLWQEGETYPKLETLTC